MKRRLQVVLADQDMKRLRDLADREQVTMSDWVRRAIREASQKRSASTAGKKLAAIRAALHHQAPTADIDQMLEEIGFRAQDEHPDSARRQARDVKH